MTYSFSNWLPFAKVLDENLNIIDNGVTQTEGASYTFVSRDMLCCVLWQTLKRGCEIGTCEYRQTL